MNPFNAVLVTVTLAGSALAVPAAVSAEPGRVPVPRGVSPGSPGAPTQLAGSCPTFSWSEVEGASGYELVLYRVDTNGDLEAALHSRLPAGVSSWTPSAAECPTSGSSYAWAVRALADEGAGGWSEVLLFTTPGAPTEDEVRQALAVLRRYGRVGDVGDNVVPSRDPSGGEAGPEREDARSSPTHPANVEALSAATVAATPSPQTVTPPASFSLSLDSDVDLGGFVFKEGYPFLHNDGGSASLNTAAGLNALVSATPGSSTPISGTGNSAFGQNALRNNTRGFSNTGNGAYALYNHTTGYLNTAVGFKALYGNVDGDSNTAIGANAGTFWDTGDNNIALGRGAQGAAGESGTIRIGGLDKQSRTFIEGINTASGTFSKHVCINDADQLGPCSASLQGFKQDVQPLKDGRPRTVRYDLLTPLLLEEIQRLDREMRDLRRVVGQR